MNTRQSNLTNIRPEILGETIKDNMSKDERFQNLVLRPIIKLQNDLLIEVFKNYIRKHKSVFHEFTLEKRKTYIENAIQRDMKLRNSMKGMIIGQFTVEEYLIYIENSSALNKRMMNIVKERLLSQIQLFDNPEFLKAV
ncbi:glyoxalase [Pseudotamlana carrageenivorans]|uniref:Glyoxalase n=1 Tax=Pseudotamlana carrageenivorans TaxID=2069432 RepID=A0A2I7SLI9_9FLAO|nr:glyoxalase [Tamlana carrageenivorans]AUS06771.1 glyoxalase [Tamlana carrageenivorans]